MPIFDLTTRQLLTPTSQSKGQPAAGNSIRLSDGAKAIGGDANGGSANEATGVTCLEEIVRSSGQLPTPPPARMAEDETASPYTNKKWEPTSLNMRHREMMRRVLEGASYIEIAAGMGISPVTVSLVCSSAIFKEELRKLEAELNLNVIQRAEDMSNEALDKLKVLMRDARSQSLQATCAERVLGIAGYSKIEKKQLSVVSGEDVIRELNRRRREASESFGRDARNSAGRDDSQAGSHSYSSIETSSVKIDE